MWTLYGWPRVSCERVNFINLTDDRVRNGFRCYRVGFLVKVRAEHRSNRRIIICCSVTLRPYSCLWHWRLQLSITQGRFYEGGSRRHWTALSCEMHILDVELVSCQHFVHPFTCLSPIFIPINTDISFRFQIICTQADVYLLPTLNSTFCSNQFHTLVTRL
jgi:hypothetical protein